MGKVPPRVPGRNAFPAGTAAATANAYVQRQVAVPFTVTDSLVTLLTFDLTADYTSDASVFDVTNSTDTFLQADGWYLVTVTVTWTSNTIGDRRLRLAGTFLPNNAGGDARSATPSDGAATPLWSHVAWQQFKTSGANVRAEVWQDSGGALDIVEGYLAIVKLA